LDQINHTFDMKRRVKLLITFHLISHKYAPTSPNGGFPVYKANPEEIFSSDPLLSSPSLATWVV
jgi:hypothetical protein